MKTNKSSAPGPVGKYCESIQNFFPAEKDPRNLHVSNALIMMDVSEKHLLETYANLSLTLRNDVRSANFDAYKAELIKHIDTLFGGLDAYKQALSEIMPPRV